MQDELKVSGGSAYVSTEDEELGRVGIGLQDWTMFTTVVSVPAAEARALAALLLKHADRAEGKT